MNHHHYLATIAHSFVPKTNNEQKKNILRQDQNQLNDMGQSLNRRIKNVKE